MQHTQEQQRPDYLQQDAFAQWLGVEPISASFAHSRCSLLLQAQHKNGLGTPHGAVIYGLADIAFAIACNAAQEVFIGIQTDIRFMQKIAGDQLFAEATLINSSKKMAHYQVEVTDQAGSKVANFTGTAYRVA